MRKACKHNVVTSLNLNPDLARVVAFELCSRSLSCVAMCMPSPIECGRDGPDKCCFTHFLDQGCTTIQLRLLGDHTELRRCASAAATQFGYS